MLGNSTPAPRTIQLALGSYSVTATYNGTSTYGEPGTPPPNIPRERAAPKAPILSPSPGKYKLPQLISIFSADPDAILYYAVNNGAPKRYKRPFPLMGVDTIQTVAIVPANGKYVESPVATATYCAEAPPPEPPVLSPGGGTFKRPQIVTLTPVTPGAAIYYSVNGELAERYTGPIMLTADATIQAVAIGSFGSLYAESPVVIGTFKILP